MLGKRWSGTAFLPRGHVSRGLKQSREDLGKGSAGNSECKGPEVGVSLASLRGIVAAVAKGLGTEWEGRSEGVDGAPGGLGLFL